GGMSVAGANATATVQFAVAAALVAHELVGHPGRDAGVLQQVEKVCRKSWGPRSWRWSRSACLTAVWYMRRTPCRDSTVLVPAATWLPPPGPANTSTSGSVPGGSWLRIASTTWGASGISRMPASLLGRG